eukprot:4194179-Amphidinium_carterae.2
MEMAYGLPRGATAGLFSSRLYKQLGNQTFQARAEYLTSAPPFALLREGVQQWLQYLGVSEVVKTCRTAMLARGVSEEERLVLQLMRMVTARGSDVRLSTGQLAHPEAFQCGSLDPRWWTWRVLLAFPLKEEHINVLELRAVLAMLKWRTTRQKCMGSRFVHALDSQICLSILAKGRSSSRTLAHVLKRVNALILASSFQPLRVYINTHFNPADAPSRRFVQSAQYHQY